MSELNWKPKLKGGIYCSSACGAGCTKKEYDDACKRAKALATLLHKKIGGNWHISVQENLGWFYSVSCGTISVSSLFGSFYTACISLDKNCVGSGSGELGRPLSSSSVVVVVRKAIKNLQDYSKSISDIVDFNLKELGKK